MSVPIIKEWAVCYSSNDPYQPPEQVGRTIVGRVYGSSKFDDGDKIRTGVVKSVKGREFITESGSHYRLFGRPRKDYLKWLKDFDIEYDSDNPIRTNK